MFFVSALHASVVAESIGGRHVGDVRLHFFAWHLPDCCHDRKKTPISRDGPTVYKNLAAVLLKALSRKFVTMAWASWCFGSSDPSPWPFYLHESLCLSLE